MRGRATDSSLTEARGGAGASAPPMRTLLPLLLALPSVYNSASPSFVVKEDQFMKDGVPFMIRSGSMHYSRVPREYWADRLRRMRALGLNTVTTYVPWNYHAPHRSKPAVWDGDRDLGAFLRLCTSLELLVLLRPGPYICGEWEFGGFPAYLLSQDGLELRTAEPAYIAAVDAWWDELLPKIKPHLYSAGGSVVIVQLENEFSGDCDNDPRAKQYMEHLYSLASANLGTDVIFTIIGEQHKCFDKDPRVLTTVDGGLSQNPAGYLQAFTKQKAANAPGHSPAMWTELWDGWFTEWWEDTGQQNKSSVDVGTAVSAMLAANGSFSLYMAVGGTNFGFWSGAEGGGAGFEPILTSYDYNAPIGEAGQHTIGSDGGDVFAAIQKAIESVDGPITATEPPTVPSAAYGRIDLAEQAPLLTSSTMLSTCGVHSVVVDERGHMPTMETLGQAYGLILYERAQSPFEMNGTDGLAFSGRTMHDRVQIFVDSQPVSTIYRPQCGCAVNGPGSYCHVAVPIDGTELQLLVENCGRVNFGQISDETKGIGDVPPMSGNWTAKCLSLEPDDVQALPFVPPNGSNLTNRPVFRRGRLHLSGAPKDTYLDSTGLAKGYMWVNGYNIGRYWETAGPQHALYCPAPFLRSGPNEVIILDLHGAGANGVLSRESQRWESPASVPPALPTPPAADACEQWCGTQVVPTGDEVSSGLTMQCCQCNVSAGPNYCQSSSQVPSCAMGCAAAKLTPSLATCEQACNSSWHTCDFKVGGKVLGDMCQMCPCGCGPGQDVSGCIAGCRHAHGALR